MFYMSDKYCPSVTAAIQTLGSINTDENRYTVDYILADDSELFTTYTVENYSLPLLSPL